MCLVAGALCVFEGGISSQKKPSQKNTRKNTASVEKKQDVKKRAEPVAKRGRKKENIGNVLPAPILPAPKCAKTVKSGSCDGSAYSAAGAASSEEASPETVFLETSFSGQGQKPHEISPSTTKGNNPLPYSCLSENVDTLQENTLCKLARQNTHIAVQILLELGGDPGIAPSVRLASALALLDRGWGKPNFSSPAAKDDELAGSKAVEKAIPHFILEGVASENTMSEEENS